MPFVLHSQHWQAPLKKHFSFFWHSEKKKSQKRSTDSRCWYNNVDNKSFFLNKLQKKKYLIG